MKSYLYLLQTILDEGENSIIDRTGAGTRGIFQRQIRHDLNKGLPRLTTKPVSFKNVAIELDWSMSGSDNIKYLVDRNVKIRSSDTLQFNLNYIVNEYNHYPKLENPTPLFGGFF